MEKGYEIKGKDLILPPEKHVKAKLNAGQDKKKQVHSVTLKRNSPTEKLKTYMK